MKGLCLILCLLAPNSLAEEDRNGKGIFMDIAKVFGGLSRTIDDIQAKAGEGVEKEVMPFLKTADDEFTGAVDELKTKFDSISNSLGQALTNSFGSIDRKDDQVVIEGQDQVHEDTEIPLLKIPGFQGQLHNFNPFAELFGLSNRRNWWDGPNVCIERKVFEPETVEEGEEEKSLGFLMSFDSTFKSCSNGQNYHECKTVERTRNGQKTEVVRYECCYGHARTDDPKDGCVKIDMKSLKATVEDMEANEFMLLVESSDLGDIFDGNRTVFVPSDDAVEEFGHDFQHFNRVEVSEDGNGVTYNVDSGLAFRPKRLAEVEESEMMQEIIKGHLVEGFVSSHDMKDEQMIKTLGGSNLRLTVYRTFPEKTIMANCAKVTFKDQFATNGVVHVVDKVILPATQTIGDIIGNDMQMRTLKNSLEKTGLLEDLQKSEGQYTLFAPTDDAFAKLDQAVLEKILKGDGCAKDILKHHILKNVICSGVVNGKVKTLNSVSKFLSLDRDDEDEIFVEDVMVVTKDVMGVNGVVHIIEDVLVPESAKSIIEALEDEDRDQLKELLDTADLADGLKDMYNVTMFAPTERALKSFNLDELKDNPDKLKELLQYHISSPKLCKCEMKNNALLKSGVSGKNIRVNVYPSEDSFLPFGLLRSKSDIVTAQCARMQMDEHEVCAGIVHAVEKVMKPSEDDVMTILKTEEKFQKFYELIKFTEVEEEIKKKFDKVDKLVTVFAPTNTAFKDLTVEQTDKLFGDKEVAVQTVKRHLIKNMICCAGIPPRNPFMDMTHRRTMDRHILSVRRKRGRYFIDEAEITECDRIADNGVVHAIDEVLLPESVDPEGPHKRSVDRILRILTNF